MIHKVKKAIFPGSFDPYTVGHHDLILRALGLFDEVVIAIGINSSKKYLNPLEFRLGFIEDLYKDYKQISVLTFDTLTVDLCKEINANFILRGLRSSLDFEYEKSIAQMNAEIGENIETVFLISKPNLTHVSSTIVREISKYGKNIDKYIPSNK